MSAYNVESSSNANYHENNNKELRRLNGCFIKYVTYDVVRTAINATANIMVFVPFLDSR